MTGRLLIGIVVLLVVGGLGTAIVLSASGTSTCTYPAPATPSLPPQLRSIGGFDQPLDPGNYAAIEANARAAAVATDPFLIGIAAQAPVSEKNTAANQPNAVVVPLSRSGLSQASVVGLAVYLTDCAGRAYYQGTSDLGSHPIFSYPKLGQADAATQLGASAGEIEIVFSTNPLAPSWRVKSTQSQISAG